MYAAQWRSGARRHVRGTLSQAFNRLRVARVPEHVRRECISIAAITSKWASSWR